MTVHYRRRGLSRRDEFGAISVSLLAGLGGATVAYYLTRLFLSREKLEAGEEVGRGETFDNGPVGTTRRSLLPAPGGTPGEGG